MTRARRSRFRRRSLRPTARGVVTLLVGIAALWVAYRGGWQEALVLGAAGVLLPLVGLVVARVSRPQLAVTRAFAPSVALAGSPVLVTVQLRATQGRSSPAGVWNDGSPWPDAAGPRPLPALGPADGDAASHTVSYELRPERRGRFRVGPLAVETTDPFGMARSVTAQGEQDLLVVVPAVAVLPTGVLSRADAEGEAMLVQRRTIGNDDDLTTREYRPGDALRRVHWRASARHGELMVRQEEQRSFPEARLVLDTRRDGYPDARLEPPPFDDAPVVESETFEHAVELVASIGVHLHDQGFHVTIVESARAQLEPFAERWEGGRRDEPFLVSLAGVALADPRLGEEAGSDAGTGGSGPLFVVLGGPAPGTVAWLRKLRRPGEPAVAFFGAADDAAAAAEDLRETGWTCVVGTARQSPIDAWLDAQSERERAHGAR